MLHFNQLPIKIFKALKFADSKHKGQYRKESKEEYISHPIIIAFLLSKYKNSKNNEDLICAALLHDTIEDTNTSYKEIYDEFGFLVADLVKELTSDDKEIKRIGKKAHLIEKMLKMSTYALTIKLIDRLGNLMDSPKFQTYIDTLEIINEINKNRTNHKFNYH